MPFVVVVLLDGRSQETANANAVTPHRDGLLLSFIVQVCGPEGLGVPGAKFEMCPTSMPRTASRGFRQLGQR